MSEQEIAEMDRLRERIAELEAECDGVLDIIRTRAPQCFVQCGEGRWAELAVAVLRLTEAWASLREWKPTASQVNALPEPVRKYVHDLETNCDPAGMVRDNVVLRENVAGLEARIAELEAALLIRDGLRDNAVEVEKKLARVLGVPEGSRLDDEWDELIEAREAASVPREVALNACEQAWGHGRLRFCGGGHPEHPINPRRIWEHDSDAANESAHKEASQCALVVLARAEASALEGNRL